MGTSAKSSPSLPHVCLLPVLHSLQAGLYRLSGAEKTVRELKEKFLRGKTVPLLSKVDDIHAITGLLKDFLRNLREPLLTFRLNRTFMDAAGGCERLLKRAALFLLMNGMFRWVSLMQNAFLAVESYHGDVLGNPDLLECDLSNQKLINS